MGGSTAPDPALPAGSQHLPGRSRQRSGRESEVRGTWPGSPARSLPGSQTAASAVEVLPRVTASVCEFLVHACSWHLRHFGSLNKAEEKQLSPKAPWGDAGEAGCAMKLGHSVALGGMEVATLLCMVWLLVSATS